MDFDTAVFLEMCGKFADKNREMTEDQVVIAFMVASLDILSKVPVRKVVTEFSEIRSHAMRTIHVAEADGFVVIQEEM